MKSMIFVVAMTWMVGVVDAAKAVQIDFVGPCQIQPLLSKQINSSAKNVGELTIDVLNLHQIPYRGSASGLAEAFGAPSGLEATVVISDEEMLSYGWCYSVDGVAPDVYPDQIPLTVHTQKIEWFFAYSHYVRGEWIAQCVHAWKRPIPGYCPRR
jgi:hypothetical protein